MLVENTDYSICNDAPDVGPFQIQTSAQAQASYFTSHGFYALRSV